jgi:hypothetical protein
MWWNFSGCQATLELKEMKNPMSWRGWFQIHNFGDLSLALLYPQRLLNLKSKTGEQSQDASNPKIPNDG